MKRLALLVMAIAFLMPSNAAALGYPPANAAIRSQVLKQFPSAQKIFVNCPPNNTAAAGIVCESRLVDGSRVRYVGGIAEPDSDQWTTAHWSSPGVIAVGAAPRHAARCRASGLDRPALPASGFRLQTIGVPCEWAHRVASAIMDYVVDHEYELPRRFTYEPPTQQRLGFSLDRFGCRSRIHIRQGRVNPYAHITVRCANRFDRLTFTWDQGS